jgi:gas vesicle protein
MNSKDFIGGILLGAAIGVTAGILLAPEKGSDTIKKLSDAVKDKLKQLQGDAEDLADDVKNKGKDLVDKGTDKANQFLQDGKQKVDELKNKTNTAIS